MNGRRSSKIIFPSFGALGRIKIDGVSFNSALTAKNADQVVTPTAISVAMITNGQLNTKIVSGKVYIIP